MSTYIAVDLGAESGRVVAGTLREGRVDLEEMHRFANVPLRLADGLHWDLPRLYDEILVGLRAVGRRYGGTIAGIGIDSWAVDYGLLDADGQLLGNPYHYRDARTDGLREEAARVVPAAEHFARTGIAQLPFNTIYQLMAEVRAGGDRLRRARALLLMPDLLHYRLTGVRATEYTNTSTTGMFGVDGTWALDLLERFDVPAHMLLTPRQPGSALGPLLPIVQEESGLGPVPVILPATHDTASAVAAVPSAPSTGGPRHAYISSGTWSLLGLELDRPILSEEARLAGFTNEGGVGGTYRFLSNIMGLWLVQECRRSWARQGVSWSYEELAARAAVTPSPGVVIDVDDQAFLHPDDMPAAIAEHLARTGQAPVDEPVALVRAILEGLALAYRIAVERAERLAGVRIATVHVVGGGARHALLCQLTADACGRAVVAGPTEATALGNVLVQAMGSGEVRDLAEVHAIVRRASGVQTYEPQPRPRELDWDEAAARLQRRKMM